MDLVSHIPTMLSLLTTVITSTLYYRENKRHKAAEVKLKEAEARAKNADSTKIEAEAENVEAQTQSMTVAALGAAIELLRTENSRLADRVGRMDKEIDELRCDFRKIAKDNDLLRCQLVKLRETLVVFVAGVDRLIVQLKQLDPDIEPAFVTPDVSGLLH